MTAILGLHGTNSGISVTSIASFAATASTNTDAAYRQLCQDLDRVGVAEDVMLQKEDKILEILRSQGMTVAIASSEIDQVLETAYKEFCKDLYQIGVTEDTMPPKDKILKLLRSRGMVASSPRGNTGNKG